MNKTGYEIRADLVALAKEYLDKQAALNLEYMKQMVDAGNAMATDMLQKNYMRAYTPEDVLNVAKMFYSFVDTNKAEKK